MWNAYVKFRVPVGINLFCPLMIRGRGHKITARILYGVIKPLILLKKPVYIGVHVLMISIKWRIGIKNGIQCISRLNPLTHTHTRIVSLRIKNDLNGSINGYRVV